MMDRTRPFKVLLLPAAIALFCASVANAQLRIMTYNLLNYPGSTGNVRNPAFINVVQNADPHVIIAQEVPHLADAIAFHTDVLEEAHPGEWQRATFSDGPDTNNALFYRDARVSFLDDDSDGFVIIETALRDINRWKLSPAGYNSSAATFYVYSAHLSSGGGEPAREDEAALLRANANELPAGTRFLVAGDFNLETSQEGAYEQLTGSQSDDDGRSRDPLNPDGDVQDWSNSFAFRAMHSQSSRRTAPEPNDGGSLGGLDDRFDFILLSSAISPDDFIGQGLVYLPDTIVIYGNDAQHFNLSVNEEPENDSVPPDVADDLFRASDHLPVLVRLRIPAKISSAVQRNFGRVIVGGTATKNIPVTNIAVTDEEIGADILTYTMTTPPGFSAPAGEFTDLPLGGGNTHAIGMMIDEWGPVDTSMTVNSNDLDTPAWPISLKATILRHAVPSLADAAQVLEGELDFGEHPPGEFAPQALPVYNPGFDTFQALLDVTGYVIDDDPEVRFSLPDFAPVLVGDTPATFSVEFDDAGLAPFTTYSATLKVQSQDEQLPGAIDQPDLVVMLTTTVLPAQGDLDLSGIVDAADVPLFVDVLTGIDTDPLRVSLSDMNADGLADGDDAAAFVSAVCGG